jgi:hypothetical protein
MKERGKLKRDCYDCTSRKELQKQAEAEQKEYFSEGKEPDKEPRSDCDKYVK